MIGSNTDTIADFESAVFETSFEFFYEKDDFATIGFIEPFSTSSRVADSDRRCRLHPESVD
jgi:hypothetical protein